MHNYASLSTRTDALEWLRNWKLDWETVVDYVSNLAAYHIEQHGFVGVLAVIVALLAALVSYPPTRYLGSLLVVNLIKAVTSLIQLSIAGAGFILLALGAKVGIAGLRTFGRSLVDLSKKGPTP